MQTKYQDKITGRMGLHLMPRSMGPFLGANKNIKITVEIKSMLQEYILLSIN